MVDAGGAAHSVGAEFVSAQRLSADVLVIGGASLDRLYFGGRSKRSAGGAGMYTAAAAQRAGARAAMFAPLPQPMPEPLQPAAARLHWFGPQVPPVRLPRFEITHHGAGVATLDAAEWGAEAELFPAGLPADLSGCALVHIAALSSARRQLQFLAASRDRGARLISVGTYARVVQRENETVRARLQQADIFFMNENEAAGVFGSTQAAAAAPGKFLFVTLGQRGAIVWQGEHATRLPAPEVDELDPTGAGDAFCGATLAGLARGEHPQRAAEAGQVVAAQVVAAVGPRALWEAGRTPRVAPDRRVSLCAKRISAVGALLTGMETARPFDFVGPDFPVVGVDSALDYFFASTLQQFGFWQARAGRYLRPLLAPLAGSIRKGSDYLWRAMLRGQHADPALLTPAGQAKMTAKRMRALFRADDGSHPMPARRLRLQQARAYGRDMLALGPSPGDIVANANASHRPLRSFLSMLDHIGGYKEDVLRKKSALLALILTERPEGFLRPTSDERLPPIIDYHLMRSCLRVGLIEVGDAGLRQALAERRLLAPADEWALRRATYDTIERVTELSGKGMAAVDWFFFNARRRCPEMSVPECSACRLDSVCAQRKELFQPVLRTAYY